MKLFERKKERYLALSLMSLAAAFWGLSLISTKVVLTQIPPISIGFFRYVIATATLVPLVLYTQSLPRIGFRDMIIIASPSVFGIVFYFILENIGLQYTTASNASMIVAALPIFTLMIAALFFGQKVNRTMVACLLISLIGVYLVVTVNGRLDFSSARFLGNLLMIGSMLCWVIYTFLNEQLDKKYPITAIITYQSIASIILFIPFVIPEMERWPALISLSTSTLANLVFLGVFCSAFEYIFYTYAVKRLGATVSATFLNLIPVVTVISGILLLQESLQGIEILGIGLIMASIYGLNKIMSKPTERIQALPPSRPEGLTILDSTGSK